MVRATRRTVAAASSRAAFALRSRLYQLASLGPVGLVVLVSLWHPAIVGRLQEQIFDLYQRVEPRAYDPFNPVRILDIDDASIAKLGQWPWPRTKIAALVDRLREDGAASIAFDIVFSEPDRTSAEAFLSTVQQDSRRAAIATALGDAPANDAVLADAVGKAPVVLGLILTQADEPDFAVPYGLATAGGDVRGYLPHFSGAVVPLPRLLETTSGLGALNWLPDDDQIVRRVPLLLAGGTRVLPSLAMESLRVAQGASTFIVRTSEASGDGGFGAHQGVRSVKVGAATVGSDANGDIRIRFSPHRSDRFIPAWRILDGSIRRDEIVGRSVIVGSSSAGLGDIRATPVDAAMPGVEVQAQALEGLLSGDRLERPAWTVLEPYAAVVLALALALCLPLLPASAGAAVAAGLVAATVAISWHAFGVHHVLIDPLVVSAMITMTYLGAISALFRAEQRDRHFVQNAFGRFVSPEVVEQLARDPSQLTLGGQQRELTVMFTDVRNFSAIAERMSAADLTRFMNSYLSPMTEIVLDHAGTVDKYIGDGIMAFWNAPLPDARHAENAARAALAMIDALPRLSLSGGSKPVAQLRCGIGLASGPCVVGNIGSQLRFDYTALGDDVNLASRLESLTKTYGLDILATDATRQLSPGLAWLDVDTVVVMGRTTPQDVVTLLGDEAFAQSESFRDLRAAHEAMLAVYRSGDSEAATAAVTMLRAVAPARLAALYDFYEARCRANALLPRDQRETITRLAHK
ncbi:Putative Chase2 sensor protein (modular protein) [Beijerinckiaceae bacterium RH AL1]|nr:adenylate/guanylate cyclase domain-containing protein [Beijerinckiaceae bacterium]VVB48187.1 Putative Chase2 sensor protein (modular protein) [Beijerinckiaceae bacterium RH CH11]VVB48266.1 Putative Chase2 sensor protein (modular protein) [Beijerinckiaceae bacterium RH AL8]VVC56266.1 Putative Chase2 sensor protein (modular protein) [Beijerinckiaceae bacterium RH AL1]